MKSNLKYVIDEIVGVLFEDFSCKFTIHEMQLDEKIQKVSLQTDIELIINIAGIEYREKGIIFKIDKSNKQYTLKLMSYPMYMLGHMVINNLVFQNIRNPFVIIKYMLIIFTTISETSSLASNCICASEICNIFNEFNFISPVIFYYYLHIIYSSFIKETECPMTNFELLKLIILSKDKKHLIHLLNKYRISEQKSKYC